MNLQFGPRKTTSFPDEAYLDKKISLNSFRAYSSTTFSQTTALFRSENLIYLITKIQARCLSGDRPGCPQRGGWTTRGFDSEPHLVVVGITAPQILVYANGSLTLDSQALTAPQKLI